MSGARHTEYLRQAHIQGDLGLNICEAHAFNTSDRFSLDIFVVDGWKADGSKESLEQALSSRFAQVAPSAQGPRGDGAAAQPANAADSRSRVRSCKAAPDCHFTSLGRPFFLRAVELLKHSSAIHMPVLLSALAVIVLWSLLLCTHPLDRHTSGAFALEDQLPCMSCCFARPRCRAAGMSCSRASVAGRT